MLSKGYPFSMCSLILLSTSTSCSFFVRTIVQLVEEEEGRGGLFSLRSAARVSVGGGSDGEPAF